MSTHLPPVWCMSGVLNFFGEGFPFHKILRWLFPKRFTFDGTLFVAKTTTLPPNKGNMPLKEDGVTPRDVRPICIAIGLWQWLCGVMLNAVGLSGPGFSDLLQRKIWQSSTKSVMLSFMSLAKEPDEVANIRERLKEFEAFASLLAAQRDRFLEYFLVQVNTSCPNMKAGQKSDQHILEEALGYLDIMERFLPGIVCVFKINVLMNPKTAVEISKHPRCTGVCVTNTIPWSVLKWWQKALYFPSSIFTGKSPLHQFGSGGLSGKPLLPLVETWVRQARAAGFTKHINAGGGILRAHHVNRLHRAGADSVSIGSVALLRPWRLKKIIRRAYDVFGNTKESPFAV